MEILLAIISGLLFSFFNFVIVKFSYEKGYEKGHEDGENKGLKKYESVKINENNKHVMKDIVKYNEYQGGD